MKIIPTLFLLCGMLHAATPSAERLEQAQQESQLIQNIYTQCNIGEEFTPAQARLHIQREHKLLLSKKLSPEAAGSLLLHKINLLSITCQDSDDLAQFRQEMSEAQACYPELTDGITAGLASIFKDGDEAFLERCRPLQEICIKRLQCTRAERQALSKQFVKELALLEELAKVFPQINELNEQYYNIQRESQMNPSADASAFPNPSQELEERLMKEFQRIGINSPNTLTQEQRAAFQSLIADIMADPSLSASDRVAMSYLKNSFFPDPQGARVEREIKDLFNSIPTPKEPIFPMDNKDEDMQQFQQEEASLNPQIVAILYDSPISPDDLNPTGTKMKALINFLDSELAKEQHSQATQYELHDKRILAKLYLVESSEQLQALVKEYTELAIENPHLRPLVKEELQSLIQCTSISEFIENTLPAMRNMLMLEITM